MKRVMFGVAALLCIAATAGAFAQSAPETERPSAEETARRQTERMTECLGLDQKQAQKIYKFNLEQGKERMRRHEAMNKARKERTEQMRSVLTPEQFAQWQQMRRTHVRHMKTGKCPAPLCGSHCREGRKCRPGKAECCVRKEECRTAETDRCPRRRPHRRSCCGRR